MSFSEPQPSNRSSGLEGESSAFLHHLRTGREWEGLAEEREALEATADSALPSFLSNERVLLVHWGLKPFATSQMSTFLVFFADLFVGGALESKSCIGANEQDILSHDVYGRHFTAQLSLNP
jgi:hypothetical protein